MAEDAGLLILHIRVHMYPLSLSVCIADFYRRFLLRISIDVEIFAHFVYPVKGKKLQERLVSCTIMQFILFYY